ncbi:transcription antitermination factor NusB [Flectobacillus major]|jgi:N utilization substance protein B|uniref:transcription antitermination factor NusB n=1 Tax=Flectobacillus major TaxID=103 RepID=UPI0004049AE6|nr:transcription antitermination factor NusB [Flectobacillus major]
MVNRRLLRTKAFQTVYAFRTSERANYQLAFDYIAEQFLPNLDLMIPKEEQMPKLEGLRKLADLHFEELFKGEVSEEDIPADAKNAAKRALALYRDAVKRDRARITHKMVEEVEGLYDDYLKLLLLLVEITDVSVWDEQRRLLESEHKTSRFGQNQVIRALRNLPTLETEVIRRNLKWTDDDQNLIRKLFLDAILPDNQFQSYLRTTKHTFEEDLAIVVYILKTFILKHHLVVEYFEEKDLNWGENKDVLKSLTTKTFKINSLEELELQPLALNWDEDKYYFVDLFNQTLENDDEYENMVMEQTKNWEADRLAMTDMIILKMGLAELIHFSSIPVKVSINEYIELAKNYSTPKSGQFVNGLLDVLSQKLQEEQIIRKSGRGLIDNK